jgi:hypothetical protein
MMVLRKISGCSPIANISWWGRKRTEKNPALPDQAMERDDLVCRERVSMLAVKDCKMTSPSSEVTNLLLRRMIVLGLDRDDVSRTEPQIFCDLQADCVVCNSRQQCTFDLVCNSESENWQDYCPNYAKLKMLSVLPWLHR